MLLDSLRDLHFAKAGPSCPRFRPSNGNGADTTSDLQGLQKLKEMIDAGKMSGAEMLAAGDQTKMAALAQLDARVDGVDRRLDEMKQLLGTSQEAIVSEIQRMLDMQQQSMRASLDAVLQATSGAAVAERPA